MDPDAVADPLHAQEGGADRMRQTLDAVIAYHHLKTRTNQLISMLNDMHHHVITHDDIFTSTRIAGLTGIICI